jgi:DNA-binding MarR family transcriptional regulator
MNRDSHLPVLPCICSTLRRASRSLTQFYDDALRPLGLRATQFTILQALELAGEISQGRLGEILAVDSTTLTRTLQIMIRQGWITERRGEDRRERWLCLAKRGKTQLHRALPAWEKVQERLRNRLGTRNLKKFQRLSNQVTELVATQQGESI